MLKRLAPLALVAGLLMLVFATTAPAGGKRSYQLDATVKQALVEQTSNGNRYAGRITGRPAGRGASLLLARAGSTQGEIIHTATAFYRRGTIRVRGTNTAVIQPDGSVVIQGSGNFVGGTGRFKGARGTYTVTGTQPAGSNVQTLEIEGTVRY